MVSGTPSQVLRLVACAAIRRVSHTALFRDSRMNISQNPPMIRQSMYFPPCRHSSDFKTKPSAKAVPNRHRPLYSR
jgi:hypothetical protein